MLLSAELSEEDRCFLASLADERVDEIRSQST
jgi:hypothetical protein